MGRLFILSSNGSFLVILGTSKFNLYSFSLLSKAQPYTVQQTQSNPNPNTRYKIWRRKGNIQKFPTRKDKSNKRRKKKIWGRWKKYISIGQCKLQRFIHIPTTISSKSSVVVVPKSWTLSHLLCFGVCVVEESVSFEAPEYTGFSHLF